jgi:hypothetical protein
MRTAVRLSNVCGSRGAVDNEYASDTWHGPPPDHARQLTLRSNVLVENFKVGCLRPLCRRLAAPGRTLFVHTGSRQAAASRSESSRGDHAKEPTSSLFDSPNRVLVAIPSFPRRNRFHRTAPAKCCTKGKPRGDRTDPQSADAFVVRDAAQFWAREGLPNELLSNVTRGEDS